MLMTRTCLQYYNYCSVHFIIMFRTVIYRYYNNIYLVPTLPVHGSSYSGSNIVQNSPELSHTLNLSDVPYNAAEFSSNVYNTYYYNNIIPIYTYYIIMCVRLTVTVRGWISTRGPTSDNVVDFHPSDRHNNDNNNNNALVGVRQLVQVCLS